MKRWIALLMLGVLVFAWPATAEEAQPSLPADWSLAAENEALALYLNDENTRLAIRNKADGHVWRSWIDPEELSKKPNKKWTENINALVLMDYAAAGNLTGDVISDNNAAMDCSIERQPLENGVTLRFLFEKVQLGFEMEMTLEGASLRVCIPEASVYEGESHVLIALTPLPYLGYTMDTTEGYYLYPNGCGEIYRFKAEELRRNAVREYRMEMYADSHVELWKMDRGEWNVEDTAIQTLMPAWGVREDGSAFAALIEAGDVNAAISVVPSGVSIKANRIYAQFVYRKSFGTFGSSISIGGGTGFNLLGILNDRERIAGDRTTRYMFLSGESADYSGMACAVREALLQAGRLPEGNGEPMPLVVDILCGVMEQKMLFSGLIPMTTFDQAGEMVKDLGAAGVEKLTVALKGWGARGALGSPVNLPAAGSLGGEKALRALAEDCREQGVKLYLWAGLVDIWSDNGGYSLNADTARDINQYIYEKDSGDATHYLAAPASTAKWSREMTKKAAEIGVSGLFYDRIGDFVFDDYSTGHPARAAQAAEIYRNMAAESREILGDAGAEGGNLYMLSSLSCLSDLPDSGDQMLLSDESVPFLQMVLHSSVVYTGQQINGLYDPAMQQLKMIEYGYAPYFELTWQNANLLRNTDYVGLYSSEFSAWKSQAVETYAFFRGALEDVWNCQMVKHERVDDDVVAVTWSNGDTLYLNYGAAPWTGNGMTVDSLGYALRKGDLP